YKKLGFDAAPELTTSVSPVLHRGKLLALVPKLHPAKPELGALRPGDAWSPVTLPDGLPGPMGVLICLDFFVRRSAPHLAFVAPPLDACRFRAAPALTSKGSLAELDAEALKDARRARKPVLFANTAHHGGSTIFCDEGRDTDLTLFPEHAGRLDRDEEGVVV